MTVESNQTTAQPIQFKAETRQLLNILIHSLYTEREVFLRELISNASDAITRIQFEMLTNQDVLDPQAEPGIWIKGDPEQKTLSIRDNGIGLSAEEMHANLGTIAHSGAKAFIDAAKDNLNHLSDIIGQFGVGFYSAFMVAERIEVLSHSFHKEEPAAHWESSGMENYTVDPADYEQRGTEVILHLKEDALEFAQENRIREVIKTHSDFIPFPIYLNDGSEPVNQRSSLWRQMPNQVSEDQYKEFYRQFSLDFQDPITKLHLSIDAPVQLYALLYVPSSAEKTMFSARKEDGLKLYARKVLIQEYCKDILPKYLGFIDGVVDSEDLPLNVSRESIQSTRVMAQIRKVITHKVIDALVTLGKDKPDDYAKFWGEFSRTVREGIATDAENSSALTPLLRYHTRKHPDEWTSLADYCLQMPSAQDKIYYLVGDDERSLANSPHLEMVKDQGYDVLFLSDPLDPFVLMHLKEFDGHELLNLASQDLDLEEKPSESTEEVAQPQADGDGADLPARFKDVLGEKVKEVKITHRLTESPARITFADEGLRPELQRVYQVLDKQYEAPKPTLEINPTHPLVQKLSELPAESDLGKMVIEQVFADALIIEGLTTDPAAMTHRIQRIMEAALNTKPLEQ